MALRSAALACTYCGMLAIWTQGLTTAMTTGFAPGGNSSGSAAGDGCALEFSTARSGMPGCCTATSVAGGSAARLLAAPRTTKATVATRQTAQAAMRMFRRSAMRAGGVDTAHPPLSVPSRLRGERIARAARRSLSRLGDFPGGLPVQPALHVSAETSSRAARQHSTGRLVNIGSVATLGGESHACILIRAGLRPSACVGSRSVPAAAVAHPAVIASDNTTVADADRSGWRTYHTVVLLLFAAVFISYLDRTNISVAAIAMQEQLDGRRPTRAACFPRSSSVTCWR